MTYKDTVFAICALLLSSAFSALLLAFSYKMVMEVGL